MQVQEKVINGFRLSPQQKRVWHLQKDNPVYCVQGAILLAGSLKIDVLKSAIEQVINRQEILRTNFIKPAGIKTPMQSIAEQGFLVWQEIDFSDIQEQEQLNKVEYLLQQERLIPWDFEQGSLLRCSLINLSINKYILLINLPAVYADSCSIKNLVAEISQCYGACLQGRELDSEDIVQYLQFSEWQNELLEDADADEGKEYWQKYDLSALPGLTLPFENKLLNNASQFSIGSYQWKIEPNLFGQIEELVQNYETSISNFLVSCWQILLWRLTEEAKIVIGIAADGRKYEDLETVIGLLTKYLPLSTTLENNFSFREVLQIVSQSVQENFEWQEYFSWENLPDSAFLPFSFEFQTEAAQYTTDDVSFSIYKQFACTERFRVKLSCVQQADGLIAGFDYDVNLFSAEIIEILAGYFQTLVTSAVDNPETAINQLALLNESDRHQLLVKFNDTQVDFSDQKCFHQLFTEQVARTPDNVAVIFESQQLTYAELNSRSNQLAHYLQKQGVKPEVLVGIYMNRSLDMIISLLGILKAGGAYLPIDADLPVENVSLRLQDSQTPILLTQQHLAQELEIETVNVICVDELEQDLITESSDNPHTDSSIENLAYVIYTSGSTGKPKGVAVEHQQLINYLYGIRERLNLPAKSSFATVSTLAADLGNTAIFPALSTGGCLHIISKERATDPQALEDYFSTHSIDCLKIVPSHLEAILTSVNNKSVFPQQRLILGGEAASWNLINKIQQLAPECTIINHYGPTETTVGVLTYQLCSDNCKYQSVTVPLGRPLPNTQIYILDEQMQPVPLGVKGELYIGGASVTRGYLHRPELTQIKFIANPFSQDGKAFLYKTGDLARYLPDGNIEFLGRVDNQVKIRGYRIELEEITTVLSQHSSVQQAVVLLQEDETGNQRLVAYIVPRKDVIANVDDWRDFLKSKLPEYMIPSAFMKLKTLPLTSNGKVNRQALPMVDLLNETTENAFVPPRESIELQLKNIWEEILQIRPIGVKNNFFEVGGHSLLAVRLIARIEKSFQQKIPLSAFLKNPTIEHLAGILRQEPASISVSPLVSIQPLGNQKPFFCIHPSEGHVICYYHLAKYLGAERPFYGLVAPGLYGECEPYNQIEDMANFYIQALKKVQPEGPYLLGGWSMGGVIALEMAIQLQKQGENVDFLALIDSKPPTLNNHHQDFSKVTDAQLLANIAIGTAASFGKDLSFLKTTLETIAPEKQLSYVLDIMKKEDFLPPDISLEQISYFLAVNKANHQAIINYRAKLYSGKVSFFQASHSLNIQEVEQISQDANERILAWNQLVQEITDVHILPGDHYTILEEPHVQVLAEKLKHALEQ
ncbi:non-ribosomal peptide synthetase [Anabaena sp. CA = ATCC 33047]|uniref:non-ribosomal peptide synthetase n=1 Tax=Anabaena sp. (strain CA / ATCC 33047) TaxID=52271 RepID=UPI00082DBFC5|nr:non-ribosomal peptide synthetase [Anabaena sp. CA = ATCC 33047]